MSYYIYRYLSVRKRYTVLTGNVPTGNVHATGNVHGVLGLPNSTGNVHGVLVLPNSTSNVQQVFGIIFNKFLSIRKKKATGAIV